MSYDPTPDERRAALSALMDGDATACDAACSSWRSHAQARADWHAYHVIGDLLRSDEHRADARRDAMLLARVRERLRQEPVVLAPAPSSFARKRRARAWMVPTAVAAGFAVVAGAMVATRVSAPDGAAMEGALVARSAAPATAVAPVAAAAPAAATPVSEAIPVSAAAAAPVPALIRSAELDRYLAAHRQQTNGALRTAPGVAVRQAAVAAAPGR
jgi:sigma-E factor negative regulatory protein RseA